MGTVWEVRDEAMGVLRARRTFRERLVAIAERHSDVDAAELFRRTRLEGAPDPVMPSDTRSDESHEYYWKLLRAADRCIRAHQSANPPTLNTSSASGVSAT